MGLFLQCPDPIRLAYYRATCYKYQYVQCAMMVGLWIDLEFRLELSVRVEQIRRIVFHHVVTPVHLY